MLSLRIWDVACRFLGLQERVSSLMLGKGKDILRKVRNGRLLCKLVLLVYAKTFHFGGLSEFVFYNNSRFYFLN